MVILVCASLLAVVGDLSIFKIDSPIPQIRQQLSEKPGPFFPLIDFPIDASNIKAVADEQMKSAYWAEDQNRFLLSVPYRWTGYPRSFGFRVNAWDPIIPYLLAYGHTGEQKYFNAAYEVALDWVRTNMPPALELKTPEEIDGFVGKREDFIWYDMGVGLRIYPLAWILRNIASNPAYPDDEVKLFTSALYFHMEALSRPKFFKGHNNHGLYQAVGQLFAAKLSPELPRMNEYAALAQKRLEELLSRHFTSNGVHLEHSPGYQENILRAFLAIQAAGLIDDPRLLKMIDQMEEALAWMIAPDFSMANLGDTQATPITPTITMQEQYRNPHLKYQLSRGKKGTPPETGVRAYKEAGYAFVRLPIKEGDHSTASYLAQLSAFHSRTHKHADHLTFIWHENGKPILIDPGRYGYIGRTEAGSALHKAGFWYSDPNRIYAESTRAHNTVEIDGKDFPRVGVKPFGSALLGAEQQGDLAVTESEAVLSDTQKFRRVLVLKPGEFLLVIDQLNDDLPHDYTQWFTFAPQWEVALKGTGYQATREGMKAIQVRSVLSNTEALPVARGQKEPRLQGWFSDTYNSVIPASSIAFTQKSAKAGLFVTLFSLSDAVDINPAEQKFSEDFRNMTLSWNADAQRRLLRVSGGGGTPLKVKLEE